MKLTVGILPVGGRTADVRLLEQLEEMSLKLDEESEELLPAAAESEDEEALNVQPEGKKPFGVIYVKDLDEDRTVGCLKYVPTGSVCRIESLYVDKEYRRKCIGYVLMKKLYGICLESGIAKINLGCIAANSGGIAFYESEGFKVSDASYILCRSDEKTSVPPLQEREFSEDDFSRIWNGMLSYLDREVNLPEEVESVRSYYADSQEFRPFSICTADGDEFAVFARRGDDELYVAASTLDPKNLDRKHLDGIAASLLQYAEGKKMKNVCVADIHLPPNLGKISGRWKEVGLTFFKMASDLKPKKSKLRI